MNPKILVIGAGAIGAFYGALLAKAGAEVSTVCRSDYSQVKQLGFNISSASLGNWQFLPSQVVQQATEYKGIADYVFLCTKVLPSLDRVALLSPVINRQTVIVFIQNGVEIENELLNAFPNNEIISGLAYICCNRLGPGEINHIAYGRLTLGSLSGSHSKNAALLCKLFNRAGIECKNSEAIVTERWKKCVWNAPFNPLSVLSGGMLTQDMLLTQEPLVRSIMQEIGAIAAALGHALPDNIIDENIENTRAMPPYKTSMLLDFEKGQPMETEAILGNALHAARRAIIACPHLETIYALMKMLEQQRQL